jgi:serine/threonine protein kinase/tetratricopeptide (TPR) repeat protein
MKCPHCQVEIGDNAKFCKNCGQAIQVDLVCPKCQHVNKAPARFCEECGQSLTVEKVAPAPTSNQIPSPTGPTSFANGRYQVKKFLGEGGKKKVYLAHDTVLDRDVAFALIKTEKLDETARTRILREVQAMGRLGDHPNIVTVYDFGDHEGQPYIVLPLLSGGDVEGLIKKAPDHKLPLDKTIEIAKSVCKGLEFAHAKGIIHRDIKPGNVWLSSDGIAKVGDFGLAVAVDRSRLTQVGMMVGTVSYMPPEQAMGGQVTAKADLYSLGAMLYEMVTGRPPFVGDDSVAIIGQHINTPPVSPTWHRADLRPALETLIIQLLEKDPEKRPASAMVVLQALESIATGKGRTESPQETSTPSENPLYRRVFIGREEELKQLQSAFDRAISGQGSLMMVLGEPGIGKTSLCEQLATYVTLRGGQSLFGQCYEEGSLSLPYLAFVEAMRSYVLDHDANELRKELGTGATDVASIVSEIREKLDVKPRATDNPEEDRYRLLQGVTSFLTNAAAVKPMLVVLEDLHDADKGTLEMLQYVAKNLAKSRLLIIGTYRDVEVDRTHPLSAALAEMRRSSSFGRILLHGLSADEVSRMLKSITHDDIPWSLAQAIHNQTEGNPLFVQEVVRYLTEEKLLIRAGGKMIATGSTPLEMSIPEGLRDVIGKRLSRLSDGCNRLLSIAAVIGRDFRLDVLQKVAGINDEELLKTIEEAKKVAIVEERAGIGANVSYRFTHAFFRTTLYEENIAPRRIKLHQQVARALEEVYTSRLQEHAAELAEHFSYSTDAADLTKAVSYGEMAARRAMDVYDYGEAARLLRQALKVQEVLAPDDKAKRCDLLTSLGRALNPTTERRHALDAEYPEALALAEEIGDNRRAAVVCRWAAEASADREFVQWAEKGVKFAPLDSLERAWADVILGRAVCIYRGNQARGVPLLKSALDYARAKKEQELLTRAANNWVEFAVMPWSADELRQVAEEDLTKGALALSSGQVFLYYGNRRRFEENGQAIKRRAAATREAYHIEESMVVDAQTAFLDGRIEECVEIFERSLNYHGDIGLVSHSGLTFTWALKPFFYLGGPETRPQSVLWPYLQQAWNGLSVRRIPLIQAYQGQVAEVTQKLDKALEGRSNIASVEDLTQAWLDVYYLESAIFVRHRKAVELLYQRFARNTLAVVPWCVTAVARQLGAAAAMLDKHEEARQHYIEAIRVCTEMRFRPELALSRLQLAELLLEHYPDKKKEALEHLDFSIKEFREMKMQPSLERALRHKEILKA